MKHAALALLVLAGCHEVEPLPAPDLTGAGTVLMLYRQEGALVRSALVDPAQGLPPLSRAPDRAASVVAAGYPCAPEVYGLRTGDLTLLNTPADLDSTLPAPMIVRQLELGTSSTADAWTQGEPRGVATEEVLRRVSMSADLCPTTTVETIDFDPDPTEAVLEHYDIETITPLGDGRALVVTGTLTEEWQPVRRAYVIDRSGQSRPVDIEVRGTGSSSLPRGLFRTDARGGLWHVAFDGKVSRGTLEGGLDFVDDVDLGRAELTDAFVAESAARGEPVMFVAMSSGNSGTLLEVGARDPVASSVGRLSYPRAVAVSGDELMIAGLTLFEPIVARAVRDPSGAWITTREPIPSVPAVAAEKRYSEATVNATIDPRGHVVLTQAFLTPPFGVRAWSSWIERQAGTWQRVDGVDTSFAAQGSLSMGGGLLAAAGNVDDLGVLVLRQRGAGSCRRLEYARARDRGPVARPALAVLDPDTLLVVPVHSRGRAQIVRVTQRAPACLSGG